MYTKSDAKTLYEYYYNNKENEDNAKIVEQEFNLENYNFEYSLV